MQLPTLKEIPDSGGYFLHLPELRELKQYKSINLKDLSNPEVKAQYIEHLVNFFNWYSSFCSEVLKGKKKNTDVQIARVLLPGIKDEKHMKDHILKNLVISNRYVEFLKEKINLLNVKKYEHTIQSLLVDLEDLITNYMVFFKNIDVPLALLSWQNKFLRPDDCFVAARTLFHIEEVNNIEDLYLRDIKPVVIFQIRQTIEEYGKYIIGIKTIKNSKGTEMQNVSGFVWEFIQEECKKPNVNISLPLDVDVILKIYSWACDFVHTGYIDSSYFQYFVLTLLTKLFVASSVSIEIYSGTKIRKYDVGVAKIFNYNQFKEDFERFISSKKKDGPYTCEWYPADKVGAYVISL